MSPAAPAASTKAIAPAVQRPPPSAVREKERETFETLLARARAGRSATLLLRGEAGIGKTWLLDHAASAALRSGMQVARVVGLESQTELAFAATHQLLTPFLERVDHLPAPQRTAVNSAFGRIAGVSPDRFLVGLGVLTLLAEASEQQTLLCAVDDVHWLDPESAQVLAFVARRLEAENIAMVFSLRDPAGGTTPFEGLPELRVERLSEDDSRELIASRVAAHLDGHVRDRIVAEAEGNPLALAELAAELSSDQLAGKTFLPDSLPLSRRLEERFLKRVRGLPEETQTLLLLAAADPNRDPATLWRAAAALGISPDDAAPAEAAELLTIGAEVKFRHPLVRSAVYAHARVGERQRIHRALADAVDPVASPERRAWHLAQAADGPDEQVAAELERSAERARRRGGLASVAAFLERAAQLTPAPGLRTERLLAAGWAHMAAGALGRAGELLADINTGPLAPDRQAHALHLSGSIEHARFNCPLAYEQLIKAGLGLQASDPATARSAYLQAWHAGLALGRRDPDLWKRLLGDKLVPCGDSRTHGRDTLLHALALMNAGEQRAAIPAMRAAVELALAGTEPDPLLFSGACLLARVLWDEDALDLVTARYVRIARDAGSLVALKDALGMRGDFHELPRGRIAAAGACYEEATEIAAAVGELAGVAEFLHLDILAWQGREAEFRPFLDGLLQAAALVGSPSLAICGQHSLALFELGRGNYRAAMIAAKAESEHMSGHPIALCSSLPDLIEAATRCGERAVAANAVKQLEASIGLTPTHWGSGILALAHALVAEGAKAERLYQEAIAHLGQTRFAALVGRARLLYGEWLRRKRKYRDAREHLQTAHNLFTAMGAAGFAARARAEPARAGDPAHSRDVRSRPKLTPQEARIAHLVRDGRSNAEIGAQLFISRRTVEYHVTKIFSKFNVSSRTQLARALAGMN